MLFKNNNTYIYTYTLFVISIVKFKKKKQFFHHIFNYQRFRRTSNVFPVRDAIRSLNSEGVLCTIDEFRKM